MTEPTATVTTPTPAAPPVTPPAAPPVWSDDVKNLMETKKWTNIDQLANGYRQLEKFTGVGKHLVIPEAEDAEGWNNVYNILGRPETHDKYELAYNGNVKVSDEILGQFKQFAHGLGLTQKQFNDIVNFQLDVAAAQEQVLKDQQNQQAQAETQGLIQRFGAANYESKIAGAHITANTLGILNTLKAKGLDRDPDIIAMLDTIKTRTAEDVITPPTPPPPVKSPVQERDEIMQSKAFTDKFDLKHKETMKRYLELCDLIAKAPGYKDRSR